jgi:hypothetical protein
MPLPASVNTWSAPNEVSDKLVAAPEATAFTC